MKKRGKWKRWIAMLMAFVLTFTTVAPSVQAAEGDSHKIEPGEIQEEIVEESQDPGETENLTEEPEVDLEAEYPYGAFAFGDFQVNLTEGDTDGLETALIPVYRIGGAQGRAHVTILYSPAIGQVTDEECILDYAASAKDDLLIEVEDTDPAAQYQPLGILRAIPSENAPVAGTSEDEEHPVLLSIPGVESVKYQWQIQMGKQGNWEDIPTERSATLKLTESDYEANDFRCIYFDGGVNYGTKSLYGVPYEPFTEELPQIPEGGIPMNYVPSYDPVVPDDTYQQVLFDLVFAENETVKYIKVTVLDDDELELQEMGLFTLVDHWGGAINSASSTMTVMINDDEEPVPTEIGFELTETSVNQDEGEAVLTVKRTGGVNYMVNVDYATEDGTAVAGKQYTETKGSLSFLGSIDTLDIVVPLIAEEAREEELTFSVRLTAIRGGGKDDLATFGEAVATVHLLSDGVVATLEDGLNLSSILAQGNAGSTQVDVNRQNAMMNADKTVSGTQVEKTRELLEGDYEVLPSAPDDGHGHLYDQKVYEYPAVYTFSRGGDNYNGWHNWEIVVNDGNYFGSIENFDSSANEEYWRGFAIIPEQTQAAQSTSRPGTHQVTAKKNELTLKAGHKAAAQMIIPNGGDLFDAADFECFWFQIGYYDRGKKSVWGAPMWTMYLGNASTRTWSGNLEYDSYNQWGMTKYDDGWYSNIDKDETWVYVKREGKPDKDCTFSYGHKRNGNDGTDSRHGYVDVSFGGDVGVKIRMDLYKAYSYYAQDHDDSNGLDGNDNKGWPGIMEVDHLAYRRRTFADKSLGLVLCTSNDQDVVVAQDMQGVTLLDESCYESLRPSVTLDLDEGGVTEEGYLYVGSNLIIKLPGNMPASYECNGVYLVADGVTVAQAEVTDETTHEYLLKLRWDNMSAEDLSKQLQIYVDYKRVQTIQIDVTPSLPRDDNGNVDTSAAAAQSVWKNFSKVEVFNGTKDAHARMEYNFSAVSTPSTSFVYRDIHTICFHQDPDDVILHNGVAYPGDHVFTMTQADLASGTLSYTFYDSTVVGLPTKMTTTILSASICYDGNGNNRIDGYFDEKFGVFVVDQSSGDEVITSLAGEKAFSEDFFVPYVNGDDIHQYFIKVYYSMLPRCLTVPSGASETDTVRVLPAFVSSLT
ncbi:MAG: hypothetical protein IKS85_06075, partial [Lachnospiraceae bacterium]|nr:hypothetical protein [Lachnospiraceae bacterium]